MEGNQGAAASSRVAIVGAGRTGTVLGLALANAGFAVVGCASRTPASAERLAGLVPGCRSWPTAAEAAAAATIVFLTVPDDAIAEVAETIEWQPGQLAVHCSGARPAALMEAPIRAGANVAGFHPLQTLAEPEAALALLPGSAIGIEADARGWDLLATMAAAIGAVPIRIRAEQRALYHAASVAASNFVVGLMAFATDLWQEIGVDRETALRALMPLLTGSMRNLDTLGLPRALTGPVARGDLGTVRAHLEALAPHPEWLETYRVLSRRLVGLAKEQSTMDAALARACFDLLREPITPPSAAEESPRAHDGASDSGDGPPR